MYDQEKKHKSRAKKANKKQADAARVSQQNTADEKAEQETSRLTRSRQSAV